MQPAPQSPRQKYLQLIVILLFPLLMLLSMQKPSLWYYLALVPLLTILLAVQFYNRGVRGIGRVLFIASVCVGSVATILGMLLLSAMWSLWVFGALAIVVVSGAFWLERYLRANYRTFFTTQAEKIDQTARVQKG